ncbi:MAG: HAMP domain-containing histidine kinase [Pseudomonadales bacterium]|nr:HAMP domain-containing histidine kinase [Pseudomonadales bacterium]MCP5183896.1 HAMP domain-containing histidine kinase [Pseudomonadales bacterium]
MISFLRAGDATARRPRGAGVSLVRPRLSMLLLWFLLLNTIGVGVLSWYAITGQLAQLEVRHQALARHQLSDLVAESETALLAAMAAPLRTAPAASDSADLASVLQQHDYLSRMLVFSGDSAPPRSWPPGDAEEDGLLLAEAREQLGLPVSQNIPAYANLRTFVARSNGQLTLFATEDSVTAGTDGARLLLAGASIARLTRDILHPLYQGFDTAQDMTVALQPPDAETDPTTLRAPFSRVLAGWRLEAVVPPQHDRSLFKHLHWASIAASVGLLATMLLIGFAIHWELRREHEDVELRNRFVANVSHELKTPLSLINMYAETLYLKRLPDVDRQHEYHRVILSEAQRLSRMIENVLDFSRLRDGARVYHLDATDLRSTLNNILATYSSEWLNRNATVSATLPDDIAPVAHDPHGITQIVLNLVDNAIKYGGESGRIDIRLSSEPDRTELDVIDYGTGISQRQCQELWRAIQVDTMVDNARGSGLGLVLVNRICEAHNAHLVLSPSTDSGGLRVSIYFPNYGSKT